MYSSILQIWKTIKRFSEEKRKMKECEKQKEEYHVD